MQQSTSIAGLTSTTPAPRTTVNSAYYAILLHENEWLAMRRKQAHALQRGVNLNHDNAATDDTVIKNGCCRHGVERWWHTFRTPISLQNTF
jgi:hypothetical protein